MLDRIVYYLTTPQAVIYAVSTALLYPVLILEVAALIAIVWEAGVFTFEFVRRLRRRRSLAALDTASDETRYALRAGKVDEALARLRAIDHGVWTRRFFSSLATAADLQRTRLLKRLSDLEAEVSRALERTRILVRVGPMLGLMGTLIPISPALVAMATGDIQTLSDNLVIAFSTTVVGLLIGGLAYIMSAVRDRWYSLDVSDVEYVLESLEIE